MKKAIIFYFEGLLFYYSKEEKYVFSKKLFEKINQLKKEYKIFCLTEIPKEKFEKLTKKIEEINVFEEIIFLKELNKEKRINALENIEKENDVKICKYYIGEVPPFMEFEKIKDLTEKINPHQDVIYLDKNKKIKNSLISIDLDGVINDLSLFEYKIHLLEKKLKGNKREALKEYQKNEKIVPWIKDYLEKISKENKLVLFSVTSKKRIESFLERHEIKKYFSKIYSGKDDFKSSRTKEKEMFEKIKKDWPEYKNFIHIGDQYKADYLPSKKAGFTPFMVDNSQYKKIKMKEI